ncbi:MAG: hypothetical protein CMQ49_02330 [Gammaproteobacteria bacterium]|nr:hypothetical protein [Gammaproteobacteria bacterium]
MADKPSISANPDDAGGYRRGGQRRRAGGGAPRMIGINLIMAVLMAGLMVAGWFIANQHQLLEQAQVDREQAAERIAVLEDRLRVTDEAMTETGQDTQQKLGFWESEVRKLWAVANERNRKWIKDNERNIDKLQKSASAIDASLRDLNSAVSRHDAAFAQQQAIIDQLASVDLQMQQLVNIQRDLTDKVNAAQQTMAGLQSGLSGRVTENEQAVVAIDAYRLQLNSRLAALERRMDGLSAPATY